MRSDASRIAVVVWASQYAWLDDAMVSTRSLVLFVKLPDSLLNYGQPFSESVRGQTSMTQINFSQECDVSQSQSFADQRLHASRKLHLFYFYRYAA